MNQIEENDPGDQGAGGANGTGTQARSRRQQTKSQAPAKTALPDQATTSDGKQPRAPETTRIPTGPGAIPEEQTAAKPSAPRSDLTQGEKPIPTPTPPPTRESSDTPAARPQAAQESPGMLSSLRRAVNTFIGRGNSYRDTVPTAEPPAPFASHAPAPKAEEVNKTDKQLSTEQVPANEPPAKPDHPPFAIPQSLRQRYYISDDKYYFRDRQQALAFEDKGQRIATNHDDAAVAHSMVDLAVAKGWQGIKIKGTEAFKREAWLAATERGLETTGYRPKNADRERLAEIMAERQAPGATQEPERNSIERKRVELQKESSATGPRTDGKGVPQDKAQPQQPRLAQQQLKAIDALRELMQQRGDSPEAIDLTTKLARETLQNHRSHVGKLVRHGQAPYKHDKNEQDSYYVVLETPRGEKTVWGIDLKQQFEATPVAVGTDIVVSQVGRRGVTVQANERDAARKVTGKTITIDAVRNEWEVSTVDGMRGQATGKANDTPARAPDKPPVPTPVPHPPHSRQPSERNARERDAPTR